MTHTQKTIDALVMSTSLALHHGHVRRKTAEQVRELRLALRAARAQGWSEMEKHALNEIERLLWKAPPALNTRARIVRHARALHSWAVRTNRHAGWDAMWCGEQDALGEQLDNAHREAHDLIVLARYRAARGEA